jgi:hypothetical protein
MPGPPGQISRPAVEHRGAPGNQVFLVGHGKGVQIYQCNATYWVFVAPGQICSGTTI